MNKWIVKYKQSDVKHEIKDVFYLIALQGVNYIAPLLVLPYLMVVLGAEKFGYIGFSLSVTQYLMLIVDFGFNLSATKRIALNKNNIEELNNIFTSTLYAKLVLLVISFIILIGFASVPRFDVYRETMFVLFLMVVGNTFSFVWLFQGLGKIKIISIVNIISKLMILPITFLLVKEPNDYLIAAFIQAFVGIFSMFISIGYMFQNKMVEISSFVKKNIVYELRESFPLFLSSAATSLYMASFVIVLGYFSTAQEVGQYSAADRITRALCWLIVIPISQAFYPKITRMGLENKQKAMKLILKILFFIIGSMVVIFIILFFFSTSLVLFLGKDYSSAINLFKIMSFIPFFSGISMIVAQLGILALGNEKDKKNYQKACFIGGGAALICLIFVIPNYQAEGASVSLLLTELVICLMMLWYGRNFLKLRKL